MGILFLSRRIRALPLEGFNAVTLWQINLESITGDEYEQALLLLSSREKTRLFQYRNVPERRRRAITWSALRQVLSDVVDVSPAALAIERSTKGKPYLTDNQLQFNLSYGTNIAIVGVSVEAPIGVDVAQSSSPLPTEDWFTEEEKGLLCGNMSLLALWCAKEAILKAKGIGITEESWPTLQSLLAENNAIKLLFADASAYIHTMCLKGHILALSFSAKE